MYFSLQSLICGHKCIPVFCFFLIKCVIAKLLYPNAPVKVECSSIIYALTLTLYSVQSQHMLVNCCHRLCWWDLNALSISLYIY